MRIVDGTSSTSLGGENDMVALGDTLYISYFDAGNADLRFAKSTDGGDTWPAGGFRAIETTLGVGRYTSIAASGTEVYVSSHSSTGKSLKFARSVDGGETWPAGGIKTVDSSVGGLGWYTSLAVSGDNLYISYCDYTNWDLKFARSLDKGVTWNPADIELVDVIGEYSSIAASGSTVYISYYGNSSLKFAKSTDSGATWPGGSLRTVDSSSAVGMANAIAISGSNVYIGYWDYTNRDLKFALSTDGGATWPAGNIRRWTPRTRWAAAYPSPWTARKST